MSETSELLGKLKTWLTTVKKVCTVCGGEGMTECKCNSITRMRQCSSCNGAGEITKYKELKETKTIDKCKVCEGAKVKHCVSCSGTGKIKNQNGNMIKCLKCLGSGIVQCESCKGTGDTKVETITKVKDKEVVCTKCDRKGEIKCTECDSNHQLKCNQCSGKGKYISFWKAFVLIYAWGMIIGLSLEFYYISIPLIILLIVLNIKNNKKTANSNEVRSELSAAVDDIDQIDLSRRFNFKYGLLPVCDISGKWGYIDSKDNTVIALMFDEAGDFSEGLAKVKLGNKWGFVDVNGELVIDPQFDQVENFSKGLAKIKSGSKWGFVNVKGELVIDPQLEEQGFHRNIR